MEPRSEWTTYNTGMGDSLAKHRKTKPERAISYNRRWKKPHLWPVLPTDTSPGEGIEEALSPHVLKVALSPRRLQPRVLPTKRVDQFQPNGPDCLSQWLLSSLEYSAALHTPSEPERDYRSDPTPRPSVSSKLD